MPDILKFYLPTSPRNRLIVVCTHQCNRTSSVFRANSGKVLQYILFFPKSLLKQARYTLQNRVCPQKHSQYTPEVLKSNSIIPKSPEKEEKAVAKHSLNLQFQTFSGLVALYLRLNLFSLLTFRRTGLNQDLV
ncbi:hypothetical protein DFO77_102216 [Marinilabilia salmonicolor]|uniref:Uncharacterized protein n=1 Tax=Marinilabilia salmonicolor TaxID=989 RepID=A0A368VJ82_9BACT|nr:hypothetical protein DFO77_102216 [Marinilabilia salmonicolor]